jgi:uncharacterized integral membrane protein (TIGR00698 family)
MTMVSDQGARRPGTVIGETLVSLIRLLPGLILVAGVAWLGLRSSDLIGTELLGFDKSPVSGIMMSIIVGLAIGNLLSLPAWLKPGIKFSVKGVLRLGIILLGIRLSVGDVLRLGALGVPLIVFCLVGALVVAGWLGRRLNLPPRLSALIAVGTSICGATAIVATGPAIDADDEELTYAVANITVFGLLAMLLYPYLAHMLFPHNLTNAGLFLGTAIHETAQVAGSGLIYAELFDADKALEAATVAKLVRNLMMIAVIPMIAYRHQQRNLGLGPTGKKFRLLKLFPVFILGFLLLAIVRSVGDAALETGKTEGLFDASDWDSFTSFVKLWAENFLAMAMAGVGLGTSFKRLRGLGLKPFYVGLGAAGSVSAISLFGIVILQMVGLN